MSAMAAAMMDSNGYTGKTKGTQGNGAEGLRATIKWLRLQRIVQKITGKKVNLHCSTSLQSNIMAAVSYAEEECDIVLNLNNVKSIEKLLAIS